jgi:hypothetical protein
MHQDAHEFLNYTLNTIAEDVQKYQQRIADENSSIHSDSSQGNGTDSSTGTHTHTHNLTHYMKYLHYTFIFSFKS